MSERHEMSRKRAGVVTVSTRGQGPLNRCEEQGGEAISKGTCGKRHKFTGVVDPLAAERGGEIRDVSRREIGKARRLAVVKSERSADGYGIREEVCAKLIIDEESRQHGLNLG